VVNRAGEPVSVSETNSQNSSPLLVIGDSFIGVPNDYGVFGADLLAHIAYETGIIPSRVQDVAATMMPRLSRMGKEFFKDRRVVVFAFSLNSMFGKSTVNPPYYDWAVIDFAE
jgi:hypothetical protein